MFFKLNSKSQIEFLKFLYILILCYICLLLGGEVTITSLQHISFMAMVLYLILTIKYSCPGSMVVIALFWRFSGGLYKILDHILIDVDSCHSLHNLVTNIHKLVKTSRDYCCAMKSPTAEGKVSKGK